MMDARRNGLVLLALLLLTQTTISAQTGFWAGKDADRFCLCGNLRLASDKAQFLQEVS